MLAACDAGVMTAALFGFGCDAWAAGANGHVYDTVGLVATPPAATQTIRGLLTYPEPMAVGDQGQMLHLF